MRSKATNGKKAVLIAVTTILVAGLSFLAFANEGGEHGGAGASHEQMMDLLYRTIQFIALAGIVFWALKKANVKGLLAERRVNIQKMLEEATAAREVAERKFAEYSTKLEKANKEIDEIYAAVRQEGEAEKARIIAEAKAAAEKIKDQARTAADQEVAKARAELRDEAARLAIELAGKTLKENFKKEDQDRFVSEYLSKVVKLH